MFACLLIKLASSLGKILRRFKRNRLVNDALSKHVSSPAFDSERYGLFGSISNSLYETTRKSRGGWCWITVNVLIRNFVDEKQNKPQFARVGDTTKTLRSHDFQNFRNSIRNQFGLW